MRDCCFKCLAVRLKSVLCVGGKTARCQLQHPIPMIVLWEGNPRIPRLVMGRVNLCRPWVKVESQVPVVMG